MAHDSNKNFQLRSPIVLYQNGTTLLEVLITLVVVLIGLLGLIGLQTKAQQAELESYQRTQALILVQDMVDSIKANRKAALCFAVTTGLGSPYLGTTGSGSATLPTCGTTGTSADTVATESIAQWNALLRGAAEWQGTTSTNNANVGAMIGARGCVARDAAAGNTPETYTVAVAWQGLSETVAITAPGGSPTGLKNAVACGTGEFGSEPRRRVVWTTFSFPNQS